MNGGDVRRLAQEAAMLQSAPFPVSSLALRDFGVLLLAVPVHAAAPPPGISLAEQARAVLARHCGCHDGPGKPKGGFGYVLDRCRPV
jgi:hypothetical protein